MAKKKIEQLIPLDTNVIVESFEEQMSKSYIDYAMSVIVTRALPDVRDGLKPVQRRILYSMQDLGLNYNKPHRKSAKIVGDAMGRFHPHGDSSIYGAMVNMSKEWVYNHPLVDKHGNLGSIEGDGAAAMRYCVTGDTLINTDKGLKRIDEIVPNTARNSDNRININVKSIGGKINHSTVLFNSSYQKIFHIILKNGMDIKVSGNHPLLIFDEKNKKYRWVVASELKNNMLCVIDSNIENAMFGTNDDYAQAATLAKSFKKGSKTSEIPKEVFEGNRNYLLFYIKTLFGDSKTLMTKSEKFAKQLQILLSTQLGFFSSKYYNTTTRQYIIKISDSVRKYNNVEIKSITRLKEKEIVYSIKVESRCHSFTGNGFINHNTEARLSKMSQDILLSDIDKKPVDFVPNYDDSEEEPTVLPAKIPNLLISGSEGIAVGMACSIPTHNLKEVIEATQLMLSKKNVKLEELLEIIQGPDFATGGIISNKKDLFEMYKTGKGKIRIRGKAEIVEQNNRPCIKITEIPATMIGAIDKFISDIGDLMRNKKLLDVTNVANLSGKEGIEILIELKKGSNPEKTLNILYKKAKLEDTFSFNMLAIHNNEPKTYSLIDYLNTFIDFQVEINTKKYETLLAKALKDKEVKEGLVKAIDIIDLIIEILRGSKTKKDAKDCLMSGNISNIKLKTKQSEKLASKLNFSELQTDAILGMPLQNLIGLELNALLKDLEKCNKNIKEYQGYLDSPTKMKNKIKSDLEEIKQEYSIPRKTKISDEKEVILEKEEIVEQNYYLLVDKFRYAKLIDDATYQRNIESIPNDYINCFEISNMDKLYLFTNDGKCHKIKVLDIPLCKYKDKGTPLENISNLISSENIVFIETGKNVLNNKYIFVTNKGYVKIVHGSEFESTTKTVVATKLPEDAELLSIKLCDKNEIILGTKNGYFIRFKTSEISEMKKTSNGVRGIKLKDDDVVNICCTGSSSDNFIVDEKEYPFSKIKLSKRDGIGTKSKL